MALTRPRSVGVEQVGCWALEQLGLGDLLGELGLNGPIRRFLIKFMLLPLASPHKTPGMSARREHG